MTARRLASNSLRDEGTITLCNALSESKASKLQRLDIRANGITGKGAASVAAYLAVTASLTVTDMRYNELDTESATMLANIAKEKMISLCGITPEQTEADFTPDKNNYNVMQPADAILLTADLAVRGSLTQVLACVSLCFSIS